MRWIGIVAGLGIVSALAWWLWPRDDSLASALPAGTVSVLVMERPRLVAQRVDGVAGPLADRLGAIRGWFAKDQRADALGFDPTVGFAAIGLGEGGAALARLTRLERPALCLDIRQRDRFTAWLGQRTGASARFDGETLRVAERAWPVVTRGAWTCLGHASASSAQLKAAFTDEARLIDAPLQADLNRPDALVQAGWSARQATRWAHEMKKTALAADLGHLAAYVRSAIAQLDAGLTVSIHLTPEGQALGDRLFAPRTPAQVSRYLALDGWGAARISLALPTATDALATALPPSTPAGQKQAITLGRMALPMTAGLNWQQLITALDGTVAVGVDLRVDDGKPPSLLVLGVQDQAAAQAGVAAVAKKFGEGGGLLGLGTAKAETVAGVQAWRLKLKAGDAWVHLAQGAIVVASSPAVLSRALAPRAVKPGWTVLDKAGVVLSVAADLAALRDRLPATAPRGGLEGETLSLGIHRTPTALVLRVDDQSGVHLDTLIGLGLWARGQARAAAIKAPSPSPAEP